MMNLLMRLEVSHLYNVEMNYYIVSRIIDSEIGKISNMIQIFTMVDYYTIELDIHLKTKFLCS